MASSFFGNEDSHLTPLFRQIDELTEVSDDADLCVRREPILEACKKLGEKDLETVRQYLDITPAKNLIAF